MERVQEIQAWKINGFIMLPVHLVLVIGVILSFLNDFPVIGVGLAVIGVILTGGYVMIQPNESRVLTLFGKYSGVIRSEGFYYVNPFSVRSKISLRVRNFHTGKLKVNDADGNPIEIGAVIVWKVDHPAQAKFHVDDYEQFIAIQSETAIRSLASRFPYDAPHEIASLRGNPVEIAHSLEKELAERLEMAGIAVLEARISHLAYAPEIAQVMLRRQQAAAVVAARKLLVEGAMGMVEHVISHLESQGFELDEDKKAAMANNLLVALVSEGHTTPVINTGTLYQ